MEGKRLLAVGKHQSSSSSSELESPKTICDGQLFEHNIQLYLADCFGIQVPSTEFWITLTIMKEGPKVTIETPPINFQTGPFANNLFELNNPYSLNEVGVPGTFLPPAQNGGYLYTSSGFLPKEIRPDQLLSLSFFGPSNNGNNIPFALIPAAPGAVPIVSGVEFTPPSPGFLLQITNAGALVVQGVGTLGNIIPPGPQNILPTTFSYFLKPKKKLADNTQISFGQINTAVFPAFSPSSVNGVRDTQVNDAFDGVVAYSWADNSNVPDQAVNFNTVGVAVAIGKVKDGKLKMRKPMFIPTPQNYTIFDTAIAINRTNKKNIVVSYGLLNTDFPNNDQPPNACYRAVSFDGGKTFPTNGPTNVQPSGILAIPGFPVFPGGFGDCRGVGADKFGNFWYSSNNAFDTSGENIFIGQPFFMASSDGGITWTLVYTFPSFGPLGNYDFPQFCFGGDGQGGYGMWMNADLLPLDNVPIASQFPAVAFLPITGLGSFGTAQFTVLTQLENAVTVAALAASPDGRLWIYGQQLGLGTIYPFPGSGINNTRTLFKSPGALAANFAGPFEVAIQNLFGVDIFLPTYDSQPAFGMFNLIQDVLYDDKRQALYVSIGAPFPDMSQNNKIYLLISRTNGQTWSNPIEVSNTTFANRGFASMALDTVTGDLLFGWYDGRNYENLTGLNYYGVVVASSCLDKLVTAIPYSNPEYTIPPAAPADLEKIKANVSKMTATTVSRESRMLKKLRSRMGSVQIGRAIPKKP